MKSGHPQPEGSERAEQARKRILEAAVGHFSQNGLAGARTGAIAEAAQVSKALLYYYFESKDKLYTAALQDAAGSVVESSFAALEAGASAGESLLRLVLNHFDRLSSQHEFQNLMQQEMVRFRRGESARISILTKSLYGPLLGRMRAVVREGIRGGELCENDWLQIVYSALGANVFYFLSVPIMRVALSCDPLDPPLLKSRRKAALAFLAQALFRDRKQGAKLARRVLATTPMPATPLSRTPPPRMLRPGAGRPA